MCVQWIFESTAEGCFRDRLAQTKNLRELQPCFQHRVMFRHIDLSARFGRGLVTICVPPRSGSFSCSHLHVAREYDGCLTTARESWSLDSREPFLRADRL